MLAQSFKTADELEITEAQKAALMKVLVLLETEKLVHVAAGLIYAKSEPKFAGQFNMNQWRGENHCGTICCIGGTAELVGNLERHEFHDAACEKNVELRHLFYPTSAAIDWESITPAQAAIALRSYLTTGDSHWELAVA